MKRTAWKAIIICLALLVSVSSTIAYLTDTDSDVNVMTLGKVDIRLREQERTSDGGYDDFHDNHPLIPGVYPNLEQDEKGFWKNARNAVDKIVSVENNGKSTAYVRLWFAFEVSGEKDFFQDKILLNRNEDPQEWTWKFLPDTMDYNGERYVVATATYLKELPVGSVTPVSLRQVMLASSATNEDIAALGEEYSILVVAQGVQAAGFSSAEQALDEGFGRVSIDNHPFTGMTGGESYIPVTRNGLEKVLDNQQFGGSGAVKSITFGRLSEYSHVVENVTSVPVEEQKDNADLMPLLFSVAYAEEDGVAAYYVQGDDGLYHVYVLSEGAIRLPNNCEGLLEDFGELTVFSATNLDAKDVEHMKNFFKGCNNLTVVKVPEGTTSIDESMFKDCENLQAVDIPGTVEQVNPQAFKDSKNDVILIVVEGSKAEESCKENNMNVQTVPFIWYNMGDHIRIEKYIGTEPDVAVPEEIDNQPVEVMSANAFAMMDYVINVQLPSTLGQMDYGVFIGCKNLVSVSIPASLRRIGSDCFYGCESLASITLPRGVTKLESGAFSWCKSLRTVALPDTLTYLGNNAFSGCENLESITFSQGLTHIGMEVFSDTKLTNLVLPGTVKWIASAAFSGMNHLRSITIPRGVTSLGWDCITDSGNLTIRVYPDSEAQVYCDKHALPYVLLDNSGNDVSTVTPAPGQMPEPAPVPDPDPSDVDCFRAFVMKGYTFIDRYEDINTPAVSVNVPEWLLGHRVRVIGMSAFAAKLHLQSVTLPDGLWEIEPTAFSGSTRLTSVDIPDSVNNLGQEAFSFCESLVNVNIPTGISSINASTFVGCSSLRTMFIPGNVERIEREAFRGCSALESVEIQEGVTYIGPRVFADCRSLRSVNIPRSVTSIGHGVFEGCGLVQATVYQNTVGHTYCMENGIPFYLLNAEGEIISRPDPTPEPEVTPDPGTGPSEPVDGVPFEWINMGDHIVITKYMGLEGDVVVPATIENLPVTVLGMNAFAVMEYVKTVQLPDTLKIIEGAVFPDTKYMTTCDIPAGVTYIGESAFFGCNALQSVTIPVGVTEILDGTFGWCSSLTNVTIPGNVKSVGNMAFHDCGCLTSVVFEDGVESMGNKVFQGCWSLNSVTIPASVTSMEKDVFEDCPNVTVYAPAGSYAEIWCGKNEISFQEQ